MLFLNALFLSGTKEQLSKKKKATSVKKDEAQGTCTVRGHFYVTIFLHYCFGASVSLGFGV